MIGPPRTASPRRIAACVSYYGCGPYVRRAVDSLLSQTYRDITVFVINDGDPQPPWQWLADIRDPRLIRFDLSQNCGPYMAAAVALKATSAPYFLIQDADDWSPPSRAGCLLDCLERDAADFAVSAQIHYSESSEKPIASRLRWSSLSADGSAGGQFVIRTKLNPEFILRAPHHGLFRTASLRRIGGYYGGFRVSYDMLLTNLILMTGRISHLPQPLYYRMVRPQSLTQSVSTGMQSQFRKETESAISVLYKRCFNAYAAYLAGKIASADLAGSILHIITNNVPAAQARFLEFETERLKKIVQ